jgi:hypothetical protein
LDPEVTSGSDFESTHPKDASIGLSGADLLSSHDKGQEREEPYEATSLKYGSEAAAGWATDPPTVTSSPSVARPASQSERLRSP